MSGHDTLIERLMAHSCGCGGPCGQQTPSYIAEAASRLARAEAALETLKTEAAAQFKRDGEKLTEADRRAEGLKAALEEAREDILGVYDECAGVAVPAHPAPYRQVELYRQTIRKLKARARSLSHGEDK